MAILSHVKELLLHFNSQDNVAKILDAIYRHDRLECLKISFTEEWESYPMENFLDGLVISCTRLSRLALDCNNAPSTKSMDTLKRLPHLNEFGFSTRGTDIMDSFWDAIRTFPQLKCIKIYHSSV